MVMVTGYPDTEMATSFLKKGVKDYLVKPVEKEKHSECGCQDSCRRERHQAVIPRAKKLNPIRVVQRN